MKVWVLAGLFTLVSAPAFALDVGSDAECQVDDMRRQMDQVTSETESGSVPTTTAVPTVAPAVRPMPTQRQAAVAAPADRVPVTRRRNGKRIPDAQLIGPRGAL